MVDFGFSLPPTRHVVSLENKSPIVFHYKPVAVYFVNAHKIKSALAALLKNPFFFSKCLKTLVFKC